MVSAERKKENNSEVGVTRQGVKSRDKNDRPTGVS